MIKVNNKMLKEFMKIMDNYGEFLFGTNEEIKKLNGYNQKDDKTLFLSVAHKCLYNIDELKKDFELNPEIFF